MDSEGQRDAIVEFYQRLGSTTSFSDGHRQAVDTELAGMLTIWDDASPAHEDPWQAIRNKCSMYKFGSHWPWASAATSENFLLTLRVVSEGRGRGLSNAPYDIR
ncbi:hypothetical protein [Rhodococcus sp. SORGH_AS_0301]|uniref:hypothetical protein n=1 Tax=Rhodococcus sp. SORGH_AS_0301 TaxID=3041780 RepID=UPI00278730D6|nr:hypothetical protein [Rhodococcus sp. SORGH_AS_0301]MDQ1181846.1 hypothetical protein [Rhodococcus sp. SORGH_AS_0301]